ncbi:MAG: lysophospholipid acyltransferase family protein [Candidatus Limivicinus sp.]|jgi:hypothetical protein
MDKNEKYKHSKLFLFLRWLVSVFYGKFEILGAENLPDEACVVVGNHSQMHGPIVAELFFPGKCCTWCAGQMMNADEVQAYSYKDFWSYKPRYIRWFYKILSYLIVPISVRVFNSAKTIGVYHDTRIISTFRRTVEALHDGTSIIIFPEHDADYNHILCDFQTKFVDVARFYYRKYKKDISFVPFYIAPKLKKGYIGKPVQFDHSAAIEEERERICHYLMDEITETACSLPEHTVVPYRNLSPKLYGTNIKKGV